MAQIRKGKGEGENRRNSGGRGSAAIAGGEEVVGERETRPSGHGSTNHGSRGREEVKATSPRPRTRSEDVADAVVAMAGGVKLHGTHGLGPRGHETRN